MEKSISWRYIYFFFLFFSWYKCLSHNTRTFLFLINLTNAALFINSIYSFLKNLVWEQSDVILLLHSTVLFNVYFSPSSKSNISDLFILFFSSIICHTRSSLWHVIWMKVYKVSPPTTHTHTHTHTLANHFPLKNKSFLAMNGAYV